MALTAADIARLHRWVDETADENPDQLEAFLRFIESLDDPPPGETDDPPDQLVA